MAKVLLIILVATLVITPVQAAQDGDEIGLASSLAESGRHAEARVIVDRLRAQPVPETQVLFLSGLLLFQEGRFLEAVEEFRLIVARNPFLVRPRLELARALFMVGNLEAARYHFEQVLAGDIPDPVRGNVLNFISLIRERLPTFSLNVEVTTDTNPKQATSSREVNIGGRLYRLNEEARAKDAWGLFVTAQARLPLPQDSSWFARAYAEHFDYPSRDLDLSYLLLVGGKRVHVGTHAFTAEVGCHVSAYQHEKLYEGEIWRLSDNFQTHASLGWQLSLDGKRQAYPDYPYLNGWQYTAAAEALLATQTDRRWQAGIAAIQNNASELAYAFAGVNLSLRYSRELQGGWIAGIRGQQAHYKYAGADPFFSVVRDDRETRLEFDMLNRNWRINGFSPRILLGTVRHDSNIDLYAFKRGYVRVGLSREF